MSAKATVRVTFEMTYESDALVEGCTIADLRKRTEDGAKEASSIVCDIVDRAGVAKSGVVKFEVSGIDQTTVVLLPEVNRG